MAKLIAFLVASGWLVWAVKLLTPIIRDRMERYAADRRRKRRELEKEDS